MLRKCFTLITLFCFLSTSIYSCSSSKGGSGYGKIEIAQTEDSDYAALAVHENGEKIIAMTDTDSLGNVTVTGAVWLSKKDESVVATFDSNGFATQAVAGDYIYLFENYHDNKVNIAVIGPDGSYTIQKNVPLDPDTVSNIKVINKKIKQNNIRRRMAKTVKSLTSEEIEAILAAASFGLSAVSCAMGNLLGCGSAIFSAVNSLVLENNPGAEGLSTLVGAAGCAGAVAGGTIDQALDCVSFLVDLAGLSVTAAEAYKNTFDSEMDDAEAELLTYGTTYDDICDDDYGDNFSTAEDLEEIGADEYVSLDGDLTCWDSDKDYFSFEAEEGVDYTITTTLYRNFDDTWLILFDSDGKEVAANDNGGNRFASKIQWTCKSSGTYYLMVEGIGGHGGYEFTYTLTIQSSGGSVKDTTPPDTSISSKPSSTVTTTRDVTFSYTGSDNVSSTSDLDYSYKLDGYDSSYSSYTSSTTKSYSSLSDGSYTFYVKARDAAGNVDASPASWSFTIAYSGGGGGGGGGDCDHNTRTVYVPNDYSKIQSAIDDSCDGDTIKVSAGTYYENITISNKAITLKSVSGASSTIINGSSNGTVVFYVLKKDVVSVIDGFTITNGNVITGSSMGGGIRCQGGSLKITNCTINYNTAGEGGGISCYSYSSPTITNCTITNNTSTYSAGGIEIGVLSSFSTISNCTITNNTSAFYGGGIYIASDSPTTIMNCTINYNKVLGGIGGGIYNSGDLTLTNSTINYNSVNEGSTGGGGFGGGIFNSGDLNISNSTVKYNTADLYGGGISCYSYFNGTFTISGSTVSGNTPDNIYGCD